MQKYLRFMAAIFFIGMVTISVELQSQVKPKLKISKTKSSIPYAKFFKQVPSPFMTEQVVLDGKALLSVCQDALLYFTSKRKSLTDSALFRAHGITPFDIEKTLKFVIATTQADLIKKRSLRITDPTFLACNFKCIQWFGDTKTAKKNGVVIPQWPDGGILAPDRIRLTCYASFKVPGSPVSTSQFCCALYELLGTDEEQALLKTKFTKQQIVEGALEARMYRKKVKPLVWLERAGLEDALMQGTVVVQMPDGLLRIFNVHKNNEISHDKTVKEAQFQKRYWFFKEVANINGSHTENHLRILTQGGAVVAGDVAHLGRGKLIALQYQNPITRKEEIRLVVLQDQGCAFKNNLYGLDLFMGIFDSKEEFKQKISFVPNTVKAFILIKK